MGNFPKVTFAYRQILETVLAVFCLPIHTGCLFPSHNMQAKLGMESGRFLTLSSSEKDMKRLKKNAQEQKKLSR